MMYCAQCGTANEKGTPYCSRCGAALGVDENAISIACAECGEPTAVSGVYCRSCGAPLIPAEDPAGPGAGGARSGPKELDPLSPDKWAFEDDDLPSWLQQYLDSADTSQEEDTSWLDEFKDFQKSIESSRFLEPDEEDEQVIDLGSWVDELDLAAEVSALVERLHGTPETPGEPEQETDLAAADSGTIAAPAGDEQELPAGVHPPFPEALTTSEDAENAEEAGIALPSGESITAQPVEATGAAEVEEHEAIETQSAGEPDHAPAGPEDEMPVSAEPDLAGAGPEVFEKEVVSGLGPIPVPPAVEHIPEARSEPVFDARPAEPPLEATRTETSYLRLVRNPAGEEEEEPEAAEKVDQSQNIEEPDSGPRVVELVASRSTQPVKAGGEEFRSLVLASTGVSFVVPRRPVTPLRPRTQAGAVFAEIGQASAMGTDRIQLSAGAVQSWRTALLVALVVLIVALLAFAYLIWFRVIALDFIPIPALAGVVTSPADIIGVHLPEPFV